MSFTVFSIVTALMFSSLILLLVHCFRRKRSVILGLGAGSVAFFLILFLVRQLFTPEFSFTWEIDTQLVNDFYEWFYIKPITLGPFTFYVYIALLVVWITGALLLLGRFVGKYHKAVKSVLNRGVVPFPQGQAVLQRVAKGGPGPEKVKVFFCRDIDIPMGIGLIRRSILLPEGSYEEEELEYILLHEYTHFRNHDLLVKFMLYTFCCIYWWNPLVYLIKRDIDGLLEVKCDLVVTKEMTEAKKARYLEVILQSLKKSEAQKYRIQCAATLASGKHTCEMKERFQAVMGRRKRSRKAGICFVIVGLVLFAASYLFVVQPSYEAPPPEEGVTEEHTVTEGYIVKKEDGKYYFIEPGQEDQWILEEQVEMFVECGFEVKENQEE